MKSSELIQWIINAIQHDPTADPIRLGKNGEDTIPALEKAKDELEAFERKQEELEEEEYQNSCMGYEDN